MEITIDNNEPTGVATLVDMRNSVMLQHGGIATRLEFDTLKQMDIDTFLRVEVPKLKRQTNQLYVIRDAAGGGMTLILEDQVLKYNVTDIADIDLDTVRKYLQDNKAEKVFVTDIQYPLVAIVTGNGLRRITVRVPSAQHTMRVPAWNILTRIWAPDCWFRLDLTLANQPNNASIVATPKATVKASETPMHKLPFSNVFNATFGGNICFGESASTIPKTMEINDAVLVHQRVDMFFESNFNNHLLYEIEDWDSIIGSAFDEAPNRDKYAKIAESKTKHEAGFIKVICVLEQPGAWRKLKYPKHRFSADDFMKGIR